MELKKSNVIFDEDNHTYTLDDQTLSGITPIVSWMFPDTYQDIPQEVLDAAAERGHAIHQSIQISDDFGFVPDDAPAEVTAYNDICKRNELLSLANEYLVSDNKSVASSIDVVFRKEEYPERVVDIADIKCTSKIHYDNVRLQLSIYAMLLEGMNRWTKVRRLLCVWLPKSQYGEPKLVEIYPRIDNQTCKDIVQAYINGEDSEPFRTALFTGINGVVYNLPAEVVNVEQQLMRIDTAMRRLKERKDALHSGLINIMKDNNVKRYENENIIMSYVAPGQTQRIDSKLLKERYPEIYAECVKDVQVSESIRVKIKQ